MKENVQIPAYRKFKSYYPTILVRVNGKKLKKTAAPSVKTHMESIIGCAVLDTLTDMEVYELLVCSGLQIRLLRTIQEVHECLFAGICHTVVVNKSVFTAHRMLPKAHLWEFTSPSIIIAYSRRADGSIETDLHALPDDAHKYTYRFDPGSVHQTVQDALQKGANRRKELVQSVFLPECRPGITDETNSASDTLSRYGPLKYRFSTRSVALDENQKKLMNPKLWKLLELLDEYKLFGASPMQIEHFLWENSPIERSRKKDIQSYICKLRSILEQGRNGSWSIVFDEDAYFLVQEGGLSSDSNAPPFKLAEN